MNGNNNFDNKRLEREYDRRVKALETAVELIKQNQELHEKYTCGNFVTQDYYELNHKLLDTKIENNLKLVQASIEPINKFIFIATGGLIVLQVAIGIMIHYL